MILLSIVLFLVGILLSAFFSGSETGFYRATRVRLTLDALSGDYVARGLVWLTNNPSLFVATTLIGNNLANYLTSLAIVLATQQWPHGDGYWIDLLAPLALAPIVFVYGELMPKNLFFLAPNRLLRWGGPPFLLCCLLFLPVSFVLWLLARAIRVLVGEAPEQVRVSLARNELQRVLEEGHEVGILRPAQQQMAQGMFAVAKDAVEKYSTPINRIASVRLGTSKADAFRIAHRHRTSVILVTERRGRRVVGYVRLLDLHRQRGDIIQSSRPLLTIPRDESPLDALMLMQSKKVSLAQIVDDRGRPVGLLTAGRLAAPLL